MGKIDYITDMYFDNKYRFADVWNGTLFGGTQVVNAEELETTDCVVTAQESRRAVRIVSDKTNYWKGKYLRLLVLENQSFIDYRMVIRNMMSEAVNYNKQWKQIRSEHQNKRDLTGDEFLSGMSREDRFVPVITLVINLSERAWDGATELYDLLDFEEDDVIKKFINNYKLNLFDYHCFDEYDMFRTDLKNVFEFARYSDDKNNMKKRMDNDSRYRKMDEDAIAFISSMNNIRVEVVGGYGDMCKAFEDYKIEGKIEERNILSKLILLLNKDGRNEDIIRMAEDRAYCDQLIREYELA